MSILSTKEFHLAGSFLQWPPPFGTSPYEIGPISVVLLEKILCDFFMNSSVFNLVLQHFFELVLPLFIFHKLHFNK